MPERRRVPLRHGHAEVEVDAQGGTLRITHARQAPFGLTRLTLENFRHLAVLCSLLLLLALCAGYAVADWLVLAVLGLALFAHGLEWLGTVAQFDRRRVPDLLVDAKEGALTVGPSRFPSTGSHWGATRTSGSCGA